MSTVRRALNMAGAVGNGIAYVIFGLIGLTVLLFIIRWAYTEYWITTHCTMVMGTRVCH